MKTLQPILFLLIISICLTAQTGKIKVAAIDDDTRQNLSGVLVEVYDYTGELVTTGTTDENGVTFNLLTDIEETESLGEIKYFPGENTLSYPVFGNEQVNIKLYDILGRSKNIVKSSGTADGRIDLRFFNELSSGIYFLSLESKSYSAVVKLLNNSGNIYIGRGEVTSPLRGTGTKTNNSLQKTTGLEEAAYTFSCSSQTHYPVSLERSINGDTEITIEMTDEKPVHVNLRNNETKEISEGYIMVNRTSSSESRIDVANGSAVVEIPFNPDSLTIEGMLTYNGQDFSFVRTRRFTADNLPDTLDMFIVDYFLRDFRNDKQIVNQLNTDEETGYPSVAMDPVRFLAMMKEGYFTNKYKGAEGYTDGNWDDINHKFNTTNGLAQKTIIYLNVTYGGQSISSMDQRILDARSNWFENTVKPLLNNQDMPVEYVDSVEYEDLTDDDKMNAILIFPKIDLPLNGGVLTYGTPQHNSYMEIFILSPTTADDPIIKKTIEQEGFNALTGSGNVNTTTSISESVINDYILSAGGVHEATNIDGKAFAIWYNTPNGKPADEIMKIK